MYPRLDLAVGKRGYLGGFKGKGESPCIYHRYTM
jgi:hypothetical protein